MIRFLFVILSLFTVASIVAANPASKNTCPSPTSVFGVPKSALSVRGGEVLEPESLEDVEAILLKAGSGQLVVIDFSAT